MIRKSMAVLLLAGCGAQIQAAPPLSPAQTTCEASQLQGLVGQAADTLQTMRFASAVRIIRPGTPVTRDYLKNRLNIVIDTKEKISRVFCG